MYPGIVLIMVSFITVCGGLDWDLTVIVGPARKDCFFEKAKARQMIDIEFQVIDGGQGALDVEFALNDPTGLILSSAGKRRSGIHRVLAPVTGIYRFCLDNTHSAFNAKTVYLYLVIDWENGEKEEVTTEERMIEVMTEEKAEWHARLISLSKALGGARRLQEASVASATRDAHLAERSLNRVTLCGLGQATAMLIVGLLQVIMVKSLFDDRSKIHSVMKRLTTGH